MRRKLPGSNDGSLESQGFEWVGTRRPSRSDVWKSWGFKKFPKALNDAIEEVGTKKAKKLKIKDIEMEIIFSTS